MATKEHQNFEFNTVIIIIKSLMFSDLVCACLLSIEIEPVGSPWSRIEGQRWEETVHVQCSVKLHIY